MLFYLAFLSLSQIEKVLKPKAQRVIKIAIVTPPKEVAPLKAMPTPPPVVIPKPQPAKEVVKPKPIVKPKPVVKKVVKPKPKPKKVVKKKVIKKKPVVKKPVPKKKVIKKKVVKKKVVKKPIIKKPVVEEPRYIEPAPIYRPVQPIIEEPRYVEPAPIYRPPLQQPMVQQPTPRPAPAPVAQVRDERHKQAFLQNVRSQIMANKKYPKIAKRRHIEGSVKVRFDITRSGEVSNIRFINGKSVFHKSIRKTLQNTFPMAIPENVKADLPIMNISVVLHFNIR